MPKVAKKIPIPWKTDNTCISEPWNFVKVLCASFTTAVHLSEKMRNTHSYMTILTASLSKLSPKMML